MRECPSLETLAARPGDSPLLEEHIRGCSTCTAALAATTPAPAMPPPVRELAPGTQAGRYTVERILGRGGMGLVYVAADRELGRKVALKILRDASTAAETRLVREAQAMAKLAHPNVLVVHDVGRIGGNVYVASELVDGMALDAWLKHRPRRRREIVEVFLQAGRGLVAAHAAGIVHRDVKPANIFVGGDGSVATCRARIGDFGLARTELDSSEDGLGGGGESDAGSPELTAEGAILGTPAYMAPEQRRGERATARADQYSFCLALHEALTGKRLAPGTWPPPFPRRPRVPARLRAVIARGLEPDPARRHADLAAVVAGLERALRAPRALLAVGFAAALAATAGTVAMLRGAPPAPCLGAAARLAGVWDEAAKRSLRDAFLATGVGHAAATAQRVEQGLDRYAQGWTRMHSEACEATAVRHEQSAALLDLRMACLDRRRGGLAATAALLSTGPDAALVERAVNTVNGLAPVADCADTRALGDALPPPDDPATRAAVDALRPRLAQLAALGSAARHKDGTALALALLGDVLALSHPPVRAELLLQLGLLERTSNPPAARAALEAAMAAAAAARDDATGARAVVALIYVLGVKLHLYDDARGLRAVAQAAVVRAGSPPAQRTTLLSTLGSVESYAGNFAEAQRLQEEAVALADRILDKDSPDLATALVDLGNTYVRRRDLARAIVTYDRASDILERTLGERHPSLGRIENNLANVALEAGRPAEALEHARAARAILEATVGPRSPLRASLLTNEASALAALGRDAEATALEEQAVAIREEANPDSTELATALDNLATGYARAGRTDDALRLLLRSLAIREKTLSPDDAEVADTLIALGRLRLQRGEPRLAREPLERGVATYARVHGPDNLYTAQARAALASCLLELGRAGEALRGAESVISVLEKGDLAGVRFTLARALVATRGDAARARALAESARDFYAGEGPRNARQLGEVTAWLARPR